MKKKLNPLIFTKRNIVMQRLLDALTNDYTSFTSGSVSIARCENLINKFDINYQTMADRNARARRKRTGLGNALTILWLYQERVYWWLMVTPPSHGEHAAHTLEKLHDAFSKEGRIELDGYELVRLPKTDQAGLRLTWRMSATKYENWRHSIIDAVRSTSATNIHKLIYQIWSSPGFFGVRSQIGKLAALYKAEVKRRNRKDTPPLPQKLSYLRRLKNDGIYLSQLKHQYNSSPQKSNSDGNS